MVSHNLNRVNTTRAGHLKVPSSMLGFFVTLLIIIVLTALGYSAEKRLVQRLDNPFVDNIVNTSLNYRIHPRHFPSCNNSLYNQSLLTCNHVFVENGPQFFICRVPNVELSQHRVVMVNKTSHIFLPDWYNVQNSTLLSDRFIHR